LQDVHQFGIRITSKCIINGFTFFIGLDACLLQKMLSNEQRKLQETLF